MNSTANARAGESARYGMAVLGFLSFNLAIGTIFGSFGVLFTSAIGRVHAGPAAISWAPTVVTLAVALTAPLVGILAGKMSLRWMQVIGALMGAAGFAVLSVASDIFTYLAAYALLVGPFFCVTGVVVPATLITRWFGNGRGLAQGFVNFPLGTLIFPYIAVFVLVRYGATSVYLTLAVILVASAFVQAFIVDHPPQATASTDVGAEAVAPDEGPRTSAILAHPGFWAVTMANAALVGATVMLSFHIIPLAEAQGIDPTHATTLFGLMSVGGFFGPVIFGWVADKIGGRNTQIILCIDSAILWAVMLTHPSYPVLLGAVMLFGLHSSGSIPAFAVAVSQTFGDAGFARAYGLGNLIGLPVTALTPPLAGIIFERTHSYSPALMVHLGFFVFAALLGLLLGGKTIIRGTGARPAMH